MADHDGLGVGRIHIAGVGGVADVADGAAGTGEPVELLRGKHLGDQSGFCGAPGVRRCRAAMPPGVLPPVLEGVHGVVGVKGRVPGARAAEAVDETEDPALLLDVPAGRNNGLISAAHLSPIRRRITS